MNTFCIKCGKKLEQNDEFCQFCGAKVEQSETISGKKKIVNFFKKYLNNMDKKNKIIIFVIAIALFVFFLYTNNVISGLKGDVNDYKDALAEANKNIDQANSIIKDARNSAWSSYQEMGETLETLETVKNVPDPLTSGFLSLPKLPKLPK